MLTLSLQWMVTLLQIIFAAVAIYVARHATTAPPLHRTGWLLIGIIWGAGGVIMSAQYTTGTWAFFAGPESTIWAMHLQWAPAANHSRTGLEVALGCLLTVLLLRGTVARRFWLFAFGTLLLGMLSGALVGILEPGWNRQVHYPAIALFNMLEMGVLMGMLVVALLTRGMDWLLWVALAFHALTQAFNAIWFSALTLLDFPEMWAPKPWQLQFYMALFAAIMLGLAWLRLSRALRGVEVPALLEIGEPAAKFHSLG